MTFAELLIELGACKEAREWVGERTLRDAWAECDNASWMLWLIYKIYPAPHALIKDFIYGGPDTIRKIFGVTDDGNGLEIIAPT
jgi:hypothetical protein